MPVHTRASEGYLHLVLDGDFTPGELERVGVQELGMGGEELLLLDASGAAGLAKKPAGDFDRMAGFLGAFATSLGRMAILAPGGEAFDLLRAMSLRIQGHGVETRVFRTRSEAEDWLIE